MSGLEKADREQRRREIALLVTQRGRVTVDEIRERFGVSGVTARSDLGALSDQGQLVRAHGGAVSQPGNGEEHALPQHSTDTGEQTRLARVALSLIGAHETVMLCAGAATIELAKLLKTACPRGVTVITYSLQIAACLCDVPDVSLVLLGGMNRYPSGNLLGPLAEQMMQSLHAGHCFLNAAGLTVDTGVSASDIMEAHLNRQMIEAASQLTVLAELKSFGHRSLALITDFEKVDRIICDPGAPAANVAALRELGIEVLVSSQLE